MSYRFWASVVCLACVSGRAMAQSGRSVDPEAVGWLAGMSLAAVAGVVAAGALAYLFPSLVAMVRRHANSGPIVVTNIFLGWTFVGWVVALAWALSAQPARYRTPRPVEDPRSLAVRRAANPDAGLGDDWPPR